MELLQTIGICVGSIALVAIAVMMFFMLMMLNDPREEIVYGSVADMMDSLVDEKPQRGRPKKK
jgi:hypothetical protein